MSFADQEFERALLASARADEPPADTRAEMTDQAWARFSARAVAAWRRVARASAAHARARAAPVLRTARGGATMGGVRWRWLLAGALGGGAVTAGLFALRPPAQVASLTVGGR